MVESTKTESKGTLDKFINVVNRIILEEATQESRRLKDAPINTPIRRLNEVEAARKPGSNENNIIICFKF